MGRRFLLSTVILVSVAASAMGRNEPEIRSREQLATGWKFLASNALDGAQQPGFDDRSWQSVTVPHTWDSVASVTSYLRAWYRLRFKVPAGGGKRIYLHFEGVYQVADVFLNGRHLGQHRGGFTAFAFDATPAVSFGGENVLAVMVSSGECFDCLPLGEPGMFQPYGGAYRKVWIITTNPVHVATTDFATTGVYVTPKNVNAKSSGVEIRTMVSNDSDEDRIVTVENLLCDADGRTVLGLVRSVVAAPHSTVSVSQEGSIPNPHLWSPADPYLYSVRARLSVGATPADSVTEHTGFRWYRLTASDFLLNGVSTRLRGVAKHQETERRATAVTDQDLIEDWNNLRELGVNFVRLVHYPHARLEYDLGDRMGFMVWCENGNMRLLSHPTANGTRITQEMVYQNWNHPSIVFWSAGNEADRGVASVYGGAIRAADPSRPVVFATTHLINRLLDKAGIICCGGNGRALRNVDFVFSNPYPGWYYGSPYDFDETVGTAPWISEAGAGGVITHQNSSYFNTAFRLNQYEPEQYMQLVEEAQFQTVFVTRPAAVPVYTVWCARDFGDRRCKGRINSKGLRTLSNYPKDVFYLYQSFLKPTPMVHIVGPHYFLRPSPAIKVYSNAARVNLTVNGVPREPRRNGQYSHPNGKMVNNVFYWEHGLQPGRNVITAADDRGNLDTAVIYLADEKGPQAADPKALVVDLTSSNPKNPAWFIDAPVHDQWGFYRDFDGNGDNSFDTVPALAANASWISTRRQSDPALASTVSFSLARDADVFVMADKRARPASWLSARFIDTGVSGQWRNNDLCLADYQLFKATCSRGTSLSVGGPAADFVVLVRPRTTPMEESRRIRPH